MWIWAASVWGDSNKSHNVAAAEWETSVLNGSPAKRRTKALWTSCRLLRAHHDSDTRRSLFPLCSPFSVWSHTKPQVPLLHVLSKKPFIQSLFTLGLPTLMNRMGFFGCANMTSRLNKRTVIIKPRTSLLPFYFESQDSNPQDLLLHVLSEKRLFQHLFTLGLPILKNRKGFFGRANITSR